MRRFAEAASTIPSPRDGGGFADQSSRTDHLIAASGVSPHDRVLVFGYEILDPLAELARRGIRSAIAVHAGHPYRAHEPVDVVWFTRVSAVEDEVTRLLGGIGNPRLVAIELVEPVEFGQLRRLLRRLRAKGLSHTSYYKASGLFIVTAWQPARQALRESAIGQPA